MEVLGIDIGGSGIKGAPVDIDTGVLTALRYRVPTPSPADPNSFADVIGEIARNFSWTGAIGCGFPAVIHDGEAYSAANIDSAWIGVNATELFSKVTGCQTVVINDADAAGLAEMAFGAGRGHEKGVVLLLTVGTGIGSAVFVDGHLLPNTEFGHLQIRGKDAERRASDAKRQKKDLSWPDWAERFNEVLKSLEALMSPDYIIIGGGISRKNELFFPYLRARAEIVPAQLFNQAGIVGAALAVQYARPDIIASSPSNSSLS